MATRASGRIVGIGVDGSASSLCAAHTSSIWRGGSWNHRNDRNNGTVRNDTHARRRMRGSIASNGWRMRSRRRRAALRAGHCHLAYRSNLQDRRRAPRAPQSASSYIISPRFHSAALCIGVRWASVSASTSAPFDSSHSAQDKALPRTAQCKGVMAALPRRVISPGPSPASACIRNARGEQRSKGLEIAVLEGAGYGFMSTFARDSHLRVM